VTNRLLDFVMDIEAENPNAGEAPPSEVPVAPERVQQLVNNHFHGPWATSRRTAGHGGSGVQRQPFSRFAAATPSRDPAAPMVWRCRLARI
jgi:hypothetical protein